MPATLTRLRTRADRLRSDQAGELRQLVLGVEGLPERAVGEIVAAIDRETVSISGWTFVMISPVQHAEVVGWLLDNSVLPLKAVRLWSICFTALRHDTGEIMFTRSELAQRVGIPENDVSRIMSELSHCDAVIRVREKVDGKRGRGRVRYYMNSLVGTHLTGAARDRAQADAPPLLTLVPHPR